MSKLGLLLAGLVLAAGPVCAADEADEHAGHHPPAAAEDAGGQPDHEVISVAHLQKNMQTMRELMAKIRATADPAERKRLLGVHMLAMQEQIRTIRALQAKSSGHEHGGAGQSDETKQAQRSMMGGGMMMRRMHKRMEQRVDALEQLVEQLIEHEAAERDGNAP